MQNNIIAQLPESLQRSLARMGYQTLTPIQDKAIPVALKGGDILGSAQTGTGKTAAFGIPIVAKIMGAEHGSAIILTPTRELATQVLTVINQLIPDHRAIKTALLIGGDSMGKQITQLRARPRIIVGTPGRVNDHLKRRTLDLRAAHTLVLDETDRMLDMGFGVQIDAVLGFMPQQRQTLLFSATISPAISKIAQKYLTNPTRISVGETHKPAAKVQQERVDTSDTDKFPHLLKQLEARTGTVIVFVKTKFGADRLAEKLCKNNVGAQAIHGNLTQKKRERAISDFRDKKFRVLVATDVAARGLDIPHIETVINYDLPQAPEDYIHRIGRTARAGAEGLAVSFVSPQESGKWRAIHRLLNPGEKPDRGPRYDKREERQDERPKGGFKKSYGKKPHHRGQKPFYKDERKDDRNVDADFKSDFKKEGRFKDRTKDRFKGDGFKKDGFKKDFKRGDRFKKRPDDERRFSKPRDHEDGTFERRDKPAYGKPASGGPGDFKKHKKPFGKKPFSRTQSGGGFKKPFKNKHKN